MAAERAILHVDMNNFYASVECLYDPLLRGRPMAVGGDVEARHGIILAKNYAAKAYDIRTGEALWQAKRKCPELVIVPPHFDLYLHFSRMARALYEQYTDQVEPFGLDECWLDVTGCAPQGPARLADRIRAQVREELGVTVSIGVSYNKVFAKLGSDMKKPDAVTVLDRGNYRERAWPLPAEDLLYVGPATRRKLYRRGLSTIGDVAEAEPEVLHRLFGKWGLVLYQFANGLDASPVRRIGQESLIKSVGNATTAPRDLMDERDARIVFWTLAESVAARLRAYGLKGGTVQITLRDNRLESFERQMRLSQPTNLSSELLDAAMQLLRRNTTFARPLRGVGLRACRLVPEDAPEQLSLFGGEKRLKAERLEREIDALRYRFGHAAIGRGILLTDPLLGRLNPQEDHVIHPVGYFRD